MAFFFRRPEQDSSSSSPHSERRDNHHIANMATASLKIRTPEEAGMFLQFSAPLAVLDAPRLCPNLLCVTAADNFPNSGTNCVLV